MTDMKTGVIITGGRLNLAFAGSFLQQNHMDCIVSVDGGLKYTEELHLIPTAIVGDFDTIEPAVLKKYRSMPQILWDVHKPEKDETDTELAIHTAMKLGCTHLFLLGATGGRLDHEWSNLHLLKLCLDCGVDASLMDEQNKVYLLSGGKTFFRTLTYGKYVSFLPLTERVHGITLTGFRYPLHKKDIHIGAEAGLCVSNEIVGEEAVIEFEDGILICVESKD